MIKWLNTLLIGSLTLAAMNLCGIPASVREAQSNDTKKNDLMQRQLQAQLVEEPPADTLEVFDMKATYYANSLHGRRTTSGERYNKLKLTCAHRTLPFNTLLKITNPDNGKTVTVRVNDRGPFARGLDLDLSHAAAKELGMLRAGIKKVKVQILGQQGSNVALTTP